MFLKNSTVLFADDDIEYANQFAKTLSYFFEKVVIVHDGQEAVYQFEKGNFDVVILDIQMPNMSGMEAAQNIREINNNVQIFIVTNYQNFEMARKGYKLKLVDFLIKPVTFEVLLETLQSCSEQIIKKKDLQIKNNVFYSYETKSITTPNKIYALSLYESLILELLLKNKGQVVNYEEIETMVLLHDLSLLSLKSIIYKLRQKLPEDTIVSLSKVGYIIK